jgi:hypothetical protein
VDRAFIFLLIASALGGILALFLSPKTTRLSTTRILLLALIIAPLAAVVWTDTNYHERLLGKIDVAEKDQIKGRYELDTCKSWLSKAEGRLDNARSEQMQTQSQATYILCGQDRAIPKAVVLASSISPDQVKATLDEQVSQQRDAREAVSSLDAKTLAGPRVLIRIFQKPSDSRAQAEAVGMLEKLGFSVKPEDSRPDQQMLSNNSIWYGPAVPIADVKAVALCLIASGMRLQGIQPFLGNARNIEQQLQIVYDSDYVTRNPMTVSSIKAASGFDLKGNPV